MDSLIMENKVLQLDKSDWELAKLGDLAKDISERVENPGESEYDRFVGLGNFVSGDIKIKTWETTENLASSAKAFKSGDILFARRNAYLRRASLVDFDGCCSGDAFVLREKNEKVVPGFLAFLMNSNVLWDYANSNAAGTMSKRVKWRDLAKYEFLLPPKEQQAQLAKLLWAMDEVISNYLAVLSSINVLRKVYREKIISDEAYPTSLLENVLDQIIAGKSLNGQNIPVTDNEKGVIKISSVGAGGFVPNENKRLKSQEAFISKYAVKKYDLLITRANTTELVGRCCLVEDDHPNLMLSDKTLKLVLKEKVDKVFIAEQLRASHVRRQIESYATGTGGAMKNITQNEIKSIKIKMPDEKTQVILGREIQVIKQNEKDLNLIIKSAKSLQKSLINQIF